MNADLIAAGLSPFAPDVAAFKAGRLMLETIADYARRGESFSFETTLSGLTDGTIGDSPRIIKATNRTPFSFHMG